MFLSGLNLIYMKYIIKFQIHKPKILILFDKTWFSPHLNNSVNSSTDEEKNVVEDCEGVDGNGETTN